MKNLSLSKKTGYPLPFGVSIKDDGINFALFSRSGEEVVLVLDLNGERAEILLDPILNKTGDVWHVFIKTEQYSFRYGYKIKKGKQSAYEKCILIDPFCQRLSPRMWGEKSRYGKEPVCMLLEHDYDWKDDRPLNTPLKNIVIYEMHVRGFTQHPSSNVTSSGTYRGIIEKIEYLKKLGVTAVELMPVTEFDENDTVFFSVEDGRRLKNFWGYNPLSFFALKSGYASDPDNHINEFKEMVRQLHLAGIEVYLDMVFNHTGEGGYDGITSSFRGIDDDIYYLLHQEKREYKNYSGCGNTMNCNHPVVRDLIKHCLRFWVTEMHVDGFRFDLASILGRDSDGKVLANPPMIEIIAEDPVLRNTKIIAEAWDAAGLYQVGSFSADTRWAEWNGRFRDDVRGFLSGQKGMVSTLATRIAGSSDLYQESLRTPLSSINFITSHDGFTLYDLVSYDEKHNMGNGEENRDGDEHNFSWNSGAEGEDNSLLDFRKRRMKSFFAILMFSQGIPMMTAGDELARTQKGNNNCWCQDNQLSWLDWSMVEKFEDLLRFFQGCIRLRMQNDLFRRTDFFTGQEQGQQQKDGGIVWQGREAGKADWTEESHLLGFLLKGNESRESDFFIMMNGHRSESVQFEVPASTEGKQWYKIIDTSLLSPEDLVEKENAEVVTPLSFVEIAAQAFILLETQ